MKPFTVPFLGVFFETWARWIAFRKIGPYSGSSARTQHQLSPRVMAGGPLPTGEPSLFATLPTNVHRYASCWLTPVVQQRPRSHRFRAYIGCQTPVDVGEILVTACDCCRSYQPFTHVPPTVSGMRLPANVAVMPR